MGQQLEGHRHLNLHARSQGRRLVDDVVAVSVTVPLNSSCEMSATP